MSSLNNLKHRYSVRKTLTIDGDIADAISNLVKKQRGKEKEIVNELLRKGLTLTQKKESQPLFEPFAFSAKLQKGISPEDLERLLDEI